MNLEKLKERFEENGFEASVFETKEEASAYLNREVDQTTVGFGGSVGLDEMGLRESLKEHNTVYYHGFYENAEEGMNLAKDADVYILTANAVAENTGEILNIDGTGNRVSSTLYGHRKVYMVVGKNKISPDFDSALYRLRNVVAPHNARRLSRKTPCAVKADKCYNCNSPERICNALVVHYKKMYSEDMEVILINENLGY